MTLDQIINRTIEGKIGNQEFLLNFSGSEWVAAIGNRSVHVSIGEIVTYGDDQVDFVARAGTATEAAQALCAMVDASRR